MRKIPILAKALCLLFLSGSFFSVQAKCELRSNGCPPLSSSYLCGLANMDKDAMTGQQSPATNQGPLENDADKKDDLSNDFWQDMAKSQRN